MHYYLRPKSFQKFFFRPVPKVFLGSPKIKTWHSSLLIVNVSSCWIKVLSGASGYIFVYLTRPLKRIE